MNDDAALLRRYTEGRDEGAFAELVQRHLPLVYGAALRQLDGAAHRAEEVTQSVFTDLARKADSLSRRTELAGWLYTSTHFAAAKLKRTEQRRQLREQEASTMHELLSDSVPEVDWQRLRPVLDNAMHKLGDGDRDVILQRFFQGRRFAEVGEKLGLSEDAARLRADRALDKLRAMLAKHGITSTSTALATVLANQAAGMVPAGLAANVTGAALTGAAAAEVGALTTVIAFMTATKTTVVLGVAAALTVATAFYQSNQARAAAAVLAAAGKNHASERALLAALEAQTRTAEQALADREKVTAELAATAAAAADEAAEKAKALQQFLDNDPQLRMLQTDATRAWWRAAQGPFLRSIGLTPEQIEQAVELTVQDKEQDRAQGAAGQEPTKSYSSYAKFRALFGDAATDRLIEYDKSRWSEGVILRGLMTAIYYTDEPFTAQQTKNLFEILRNARTTDDESVRLIARYDFDQILSAAGSVLSPAQLQTLRAGFAQAQTFNLQFAAEASQAAAPEKK